MDYSLELDFDELHLKIYDKIREAMRGKYCRPSDEWEAYHLFEFVKTIRPVNDSKKRNNLDKLLVRRCHPDGYINLVDRTCDGYPLGKSNSIFECLAEFIDIPVYVCFLKFLEFCRDGTAKLKGPLPLSTFEDNGKATVTLDTGEIVSITLDELIIDIKREINRQIEKLDAAPTQNDPRYAVPSSIQPHLIIKPASENNKNYFANAVLEVIGRDKEEKRLREFLHCDMNFAWLQIAGVAGQGKSRLAFDLIIESGWNAGFLEEDGITFFDGKWLTWQPDKPHLIVFDYVVGREDVIKPILRALSVRYKRKEKFLYNVRILLVERQRWDKGISFNVTTHGDGAEFTGTDDSKSEWFLNLCQDNCYDGNDQTLNNSRFKNGVVELNELDEDSLVEIVEQIAEKTPSSKFNTPTSEIKETLQRIDKSGRPLYAYFLGQELGHGARAIGWSSRDLLKATLVRERKKWWAATFEEKPPGVKDDIPASRLAVLATMTDGIDCTKVYTSSLITIPQPDTDIRRQALTMTGGSLSEDENGPSEHIPPMEPDLLGEWYVISSLVTGGLPLEELTTAAWRYAPEKMGSFMQRLYQDFQDHPIAKKMLDSINLDQLDMNALSKVASALLVRLYEDRLVFPEKVMQALHIQAENGNYHSIRNLGFCYENGTGVEKDVHKALVYYQQAAELGNTFAMFNLGLFYKKGTGVEKDIHKAIDYYRKAAESGHAGAMRKLGFCYEKGIGVEKDIHKAIDYYRKAADAGDTTAINNLGFCYEKGIGVEKDLHKAIDYYQKAAELGNELAMFNLGICYKKGTGVEKDLHKAIDYYQKAAELGNERAMFNLGICYKKGTGVEKDLHKAIDFYQKAAELGHAGAMRKLGFCFEKGVGVEKDIHKAIDYYRKAADAGDTTAINNLGFCYEKGTGVEKDLHKAIDYYQKAADAGSTMAINNLGFCYEKGIGVEKDIHKAIDYYQKAAELGVCRV